MQEYYECEKCHHAVLPDDAMHKLTSRTVWEAATTSKKRMITADQMLCKPCFAKKYKNKMTQKIQDLVIETS